MMEPHSILLELVNVAKWYGQAEPDEPAVIRGVSLTVEAGDTVAIVGPSGSGKTTLLNLMGTLDLPGSGHVFIESHDVSLIDDAMLSHIRNRRIGFVFQSHHLLPQCTVLENVLVPTLVAGGSAEQPEERARALLERVGLSQRLHYRPGQLSGGERQRVAVVRALINRPALLLADEPTGSLDHANALSLCRLLVELNREEGTALVLVTHSLELAAQMARHYVLRDGLLAAADDAAATPPAPDGHPMDGSHR